MHYTLYESLKYNLNYYCSRVFFLAIILTMVGKIFDVIDSALNFLFVETFYMKER